MQGTPRSRQNEEKKERYVWEVRHRWTLGFPLATQLLENPRAGRSALKRKVLAPRIYTQLDYQRGSPFEGAQDFR